MGNMTVRFTTWISSIDSNSLKDLIYNQGLRGVIKESGVLHITPAFKSRIQVKLGISSQELKQLVSHGASESRQATSLERFGVKNVSQATSCRQKRVHTFQTRYGVSWMSQDPNVKEKKVLLMKDVQQKRLSSRVSSGIRDSLRSRLDLYLQAHHLEIISPLTDLFHSSSSLKSVSLRCRCLQCGFEYQTYWHGNGVHTCPHCPNGFQSNLEKQVAQWLISLGEQVIVKDRQVLHRYELDIYLPQRQIALEFNGFFWHNSSISRGSAPPCSRDYHQKKTLSCLSSGIRLYHFWEDASFSFIQSFLSKKLFKSKPIYARTLSLIRDTLAIRDFISLHHYQHDSSLGHCRYALCDTTGNILCAASFRLFGSVAYNTRYCLGEVSILGGFSRLLNAFLSDHPEIVSVEAHCNRDYTPDPQDSVYVRNGFTFVGDSGPELRYFVSSKKRSGFDVGIYPRQRFMKNRLSSYWSDFDSSLTEKENCLRHGVIQVYNSGALKYVYTRK